MILHLDIDAVRIDLLIGFHGHSKIPYHDVIILLFFPRVPTGGAGGLTPCMPTRQGEHFSTDRTLSSTAAAAGDGFQFLLERAQGKPGVNAVSWKLEEG